MSSKDSGNHGGSQTSQNSVYRAGITHWFTSEIQQMMHGFGDCKKPQQDSALLVEGIVHQQISSLLYQASDVAVLRNARFIGVEDLLFLLRRDKVKLGRLLRYLDLKDVKAAALKGVEDEENTEGEKVTQPMKKRRKMCYDFLSSIDQTGELLALFDDDHVVDEVKYERLVRAEIQTRGMDPKHYLEYCEARQINFSKKYKSQRFKDWLLVGVNIDIKPNLPALEILSYFAYETVAQIVDLALKVKQDRRSDVNYPLSKNTPSVCINHHDHAPIVTPSSRHPSITSPVSSPPSNPSTPGAISSLGGLATSSAASSTSKSKSKKRRKSGHGSSAELWTMQAILPSDVQEAVRRYGHCIGPFASVTRVNTQRSPRMQLLCC